MSPQLFWGLFFAVNFFVKPAAASLLTVPCVTHLYSLIRIAAGGKNKTNKPVLLVSCTNKYKQ
jgi:hypothetical protein